MAQAFGEDGKPCRMEVAMLRQGLSFKFITLAKKNPMKQGEASTRHLHAPRTTTRGFGEIGSYRETAKQITPGTRICNGLANPLQNVQSPRLHRRRRLRVLVSFSSISYRREQDRQCLLRQMRTRVSLFRRPSHACSARRPKSSGAGKRGKGKNAQEREREGGNARPRQLWTRPLVPPAAAAVDRPPPIGDFHFYRPAEMIPRNNEAGPVCRRYKHTHTHTCRGRNSERKGDSCVCVRIICNPSCLLNIWRDVQLRFCFCFFFLLLLLQIPTVGGGVKH